MKRTIKTLAETLTGCTVEMGKTYYSKSGGHNTRSIKIYDIPEDRGEEVGVLLSALEAAGGTILEHCSVDNYLLIRVALPENQTWEQYQATVFDQGDVVADVEAPEKEESAADKLAKLEIQANNFVATLDIKVGVPTTIPGYGVAVAFSEEDKAKLIAFIKKVVMFGIPEAIRLSKNPS